MEKYNFDRIIDRRGKNCLKYDFAIQRGQPENVLPLWVADMDFEVAPAIQEALHEAVAHGIYGYSEVKTPYFEAVAGWFQRRFNWSPKEEWLIKTPGIVYALAMAVQAYTKPGDAILVQSPVYYPFSAVIRDNGRRVVDNPLQFDGERYTLNLSDFEEKISQEKIKLFLLCSPHNPVGRVWTRAELAEMGRICKKHGVIVVSDEIHCDFTFPGHPHSILFQAAPQLLEQAIVCTAPTKTFNIAGLQISNIWIPNPELRQLFRHSIDASGYSQLNLMGMVAAKAAYQHGEDWFVQCWAYIQENFAFMQDYLAKYLPQLKLIKPEGTYFAWVDCSGLGLDNQQLKHLISYKAHLWLDSGDFFGADSWMFQRFVLACPRSTLKQALDQLREAVNA